LANDYGDQTESLKAINKKTGEDVFVASLVAIMGEDPCSLCTWTEGVDTLLPRTDYIFLCRPEAEEAKDGVRMATWEQVRSVVGDLMTKVDMYPERYRVKSFPSKEQLAVLDQTPTTS